MKKVFAKALCNFNADEAGKLRFNKGDILKIISSENAGWWSCELNGKVGDVPSDYLEVLEIQLKTQKFGVCLPDITLVSPHEIACPIVEKWIVASQTSFALKNYRKNRENGSDKDNAKTPFPGAKFDTLDITNQSNGKWADSEGRYWWKITLADGSLNEEYYWTKDEVRGWPDNEDPNRYWFIVHHAPTGTKIEGFCSEPDYEIGINNHQQYQYHIKYTECGAIERWMKWRDVIAQFELGSMYQNGEGVKENVEKAIECFKEAAKQGYVRAQHALGYMCLTVRGDTNEALEWYRKAAEQDYVPAQVITGLIYELKAKHGKGDVKENEAKAFFWYQKAAEKEDAEAQYEVGLMYENGQGVEKDDEKAFYWFEKAAKQGNADAQYKVALINEKKAFEWYQKAADNGNAEAQYKLGWIYENGQGVEKNEKEAIEWYRKAAEQGHVHAKASLSRLKQKRPIKEKETNELHRLAEQGEQEDIVKIHKLLENKTIPPKHLNQNGDTALIVAARCGHIDVVRMLLSHKNEIKCQNAAGEVIEDEYINVTNNHGESALHVLMWNENKILNSVRLSIVKLLIAHGIDLTLVDNEGNTAIKNLDKGDTKLIELLLKKRNKIPVERIERIIKKCSSNYAKDLDAKKANIILLDRVIHQLIGKIGDETVGELMSDENIYKYWAHLRSIRGKGRRPAYNISVEFEGISTKVFLTIHLRILLAILMDVNHKQREELPLEKSQVIEKLTSEFAYTLEILCAHLDRWYVHRKLNDKEWALSAHRENIEQHIKNLSSINNDSYGYYTGYMSNKKNGHAVYVHIKKDSSENEFIVRIDNLGSGIGEGKHYLRKSNDKHMRERNQCLPFTSKFKNIFDSKFIERMIKARYLPKDNAFSLMYDDLTDRIVFSKEEIEHWYPWSRIQDVGNCAAKNFFVGMEIRLQESGSKERHKLYKYLRNEELTFSAIMEERVAFSWNESKSIGSRKEAESAMRNSGTSDYPFHAKRKKGKQALVVNNNEDIVFQLIQWLSIVELEGRSQRNFYGTEPYPIHYQEGDCLFASIAAFVPNETVMSLRKRATEHIKRDEQLESNIITLIRGEPPETLRTKDGDKVIKSFQQYIMLMQTEETWGTAIEIVAIARSLQRPIAILTPNNQYDYIVEEEAYRNNQPIFLNYVGEIHYAPLSVPDNRNAMDILNEIRAAIEERNNDRDRNIQQGSSSNMLL